MSVIQSSLCLGVICCHHMKSIQNYIMSDHQDDEEGLQLFKEYENVKEDAKQPSDKESEEQPNRKRLKKHKKDKKKNKKRHRDDYDDEEQDAQSDDLDNGVRSYIEEEASEDSDEESEINSSAEFEDQQQKRHLKELYRVNQKRETDKFMDRIQGKNEDQINRIYQQKVHKRRINEAMLPSGRDFQMYIVGCKQGKEEEMVMAILNKTSYYQRTKKQEYKMEIGSAMALKKKYPGKIFIQAANEKVIKESLESFIDINSGRITPMDNDFYSTLFEAKETKEITFKEGQYVRIKKGVYEGDLGRISKAKKNSADIALVPRISIQDILSKMREQTSKNLDEASLLLKKDEILRKYTNPRMYYPTQLRPPKKMLNIDVFKQFSDLPSNKKFTFGASGLIIFQFRYDEIAKPQGTMLPIELQPFSKNGNIIEEIQDEEDRKNFVTTIRLEIGDQAQIIAGELIGCFGLITEVKQHTAMIKCRNRQMAGKIIQEPIDHLSKRFKQSQRVKVVSGTEKGKTGIILKVNGAFAQIWTDNQNSIKINKNNLEVFLGQPTSTENLLGLKKDDLIKTTKGNIGVILSTNKDNIKILDVTNVVSIVGNLDYQSKINTRNLVAKNKNGDQIKNQTIVRIRSGYREGYRCEVKHIYRDFLFLFNPDFDKTNGLIVQKADNCIVVARNLQQNMRGRMKSSAKPGFAATEDEELRVGKSITIGSGPLKGYRGVIKSVSKDRIEVRVPQKGCTEWIERDKITKPEVNLEHGKTPRRGLSMTAMYAQSPMNF